jgi:putative two-component system response regulator
VLLDIMMPDMDGHEVLRRMREDGKLREIPVIFITAMSDTATRSAGSPRARSTTS